MDQSRETKGRSNTIQADWHPIVTAPFNRDLELAVFDAAGRAHRLVFPCRRVLHGWMEANTTVPVIVRPTHWRKWDDAVNPVLAWPVRSAQPASVVPMPTRAR